jgi:hypothetical protein
MRSSWHTRSGRWLSGHLLRLRRTLDALGRRFRDSVAVAVGQTVAGAVREAVHAMLSDFSGTLPITHAPLTPPSPSRSLWGHGGDHQPDGWHAGPAEYDPDDLDPEAHDLPDCPAPPDERKPTSRWPLAVAVGCQAAAWWLRRRLARIPVLAAVAVGLLAAVATYATGPLAVAGVGLAGSALNLVGTAEAVGAFGPS